MENYYFLDGIAFCIFQFSQHITHFFFKYTEQSEKIHVKKLIMIISGGEMFLIFVNFYNKLVLLLIRKMLIFYKCSYSINKQIVNQQHEKVRNITKSRLATGVQQSETLSRVTD